MKFKLKNFFRVKYISGFVVRLKAIKSIKKLLCFLFSNIYLQFLQLEASGLEHSIGMIIMRAFSLIVCLLW